MLKEFQKSSLEDYEEICPCCCGEGYINNSLTPGVCGICNGTGYIDKIRGYKVDFTKIYIENGD